MKKLKAAVSPLLFVFVVCFFLNHSEANLYSVGFHC